MVDSINPIKNILSPPPLKMPILTNGLISSPWGRWLNEVYQTQSSGDYSILNANIANIIQSNIQKERPRKKRSI